MLQTRFQTWNEITGVQLVSSLFAVPGLSLLCNLFFLFDSTVILIPTNKLTMPFNGRVNNTLFFCIKILLVRGKSCAWLDTIAREKGGAPRPSLFSTESRRKNRGPQHLRASSAVQRGMGSET